MFILLVFCAACIDLLSVSAASTTTTSTVNTPGGFTPGEQAESLSKAWLFKYYDRHKRPTSTIWNTSDTSVKPLSNATQIRINMHVLSFSKIKASFMEFTAHFYLRQKWMDQRLQYAPATSSGQSLHNYKSLPWLYKELWLPDTFFRNQKYGALHAVPTPNILIQLRPNGDILLSQMLESTFSCVMDLTWFPMDQQKCSIVIGNYGYNIEEVHTQWDQHTRGLPVTIENDAIQVQEFSLDGIETGSCVKSFAATGSFSCIYVQFKLHRRIGFYVIGAYLPFFIITAISWTSFWLPLDALAPRTSITFITVLAVVMHNSGLSGSLPSVSGIKALDIYMLVSLCCVTGALVEFAAATYLLQRSNQAAAMAQRARDENEGLPRQEVVSSSRASSVPKLMVDRDREERDPEFNGLKQRHVVPGVCQNLLCKDREPTSDCPHVHTVCNEERHFQVHERRSQLAHKMESVSRVLFPFIYLMFNVFYWTTVVLYTNLVHNDDHP